MERCAAFIKNKYYSDEGMDYVFTRLREEFFKRGVELCNNGELFASYPQADTKYDFAVFWDKDTVLAHRLESTGLRLFNSASTVELCDDKQKTFEAVSKVTELPATVCAPLVYDVSCGEDDGFIDFVESVIGYPAVVKENAGSQGRQVYLANDRKDLQKLHTALMRKPHLFQRFVRSAQIGNDIRVYIVGKKAVGAARRTNTTDFRSNVACGGELVKENLHGELLYKAEKIAKVLNLEYGSVDFIKEKGDYVFIEANSSVYIKRAELIGINLAEYFAEYVTEAVYGA